jgi:hypothetical protein
VIVEFFPLIASAMAMLCFLTIAAEEGCKWKSVNGSAPATAPEPQTESYRMRTTVTGATTLAGEVNQLDAIDRSKSAEFEVAPG